VPTIGSTLAIVPPFLLGLSDSFITAIYVVIFYLAIQMVESYMITPLVQRQTVSLPPALTVTAQVLMGVLAGALGVAMATPLAAVILVLVRMLYIEDGLGDIPPSE
jgi:predicted PurR-regulated permease PerM